MNCIRTGALALSLAVATSAALGQPAQVKSAAILTPSQQRFEAALSKTVNWNHHELPLAEILADVSKQIEMPIRLDTEGLEETGVTSDQKLSLNLGPMSLRTGLRLLALQTHLTYTARNGALVITSEEDAWEQGDLRLYPVRDLIRVLDEDGEPFEDYDSLIDVITSHLSPDSWVDNGGVGAIQALHGNLVTNQSHTLHEEISQLLIALRQVKKDKAEAKPHEAGPVVLASENKKLIDLQRKPYTMKKEGTLTDLVREWEDAMGVSFYIDLEGLEEAGTTPEQKLEADFQEQEIVSAIQETLRSHRLSAVPLQECMVITSIEKAGEIGSVTRVYPIYDVATLPPSRRLLKIDEADPFIEVLTHTIQADGWTDNGGTHAISSFAPPASLIVTATTLVHAQVERALADLRTSGAAREFSERQQKTEDDNKQTQQRVYPLYLSRRTKLAELAAPRDGAKKSDSVQPAAESGGKSGGGFFQRGLGGLIELPPPEVVSPIPDAKEVAELIKDLLPDDSWEEPEVRLRPFHDRLIVRQHPAMLRKVEKLLQEIDAWHPDHRYWGLGGR